MVLYVRTLIADTAVLRQHQLVSASHSQACRRCERALLRRRREEVIQMRVR